MDKADIVRRLGDIARFLELRDANPFEVLAFRNGADSLHEWEGDLEAAVASGALTRIPGIGAGIAGVIAEFVDNGRSTKLDAVRGDYPETLLELFEVPGLGTRRVRMLHAELGVADLDALEQAARGGAVRALPGFGAKSEARILRAIPWARRRLGRASDRGGGRGPPE